MKDAFGVEIDDTVEKAFSLRPVADFVKGAANALRKTPAAQMGPSTRAQSAGSGMAGGARAKVSSAWSQRNSIASGMKASAAARMPKVPRPTGTQMKVGGAIGGTGLVAGGAGYALGGKKEY